RLVLAFPIVDWFGLGLEGGYFTDAFGPLVRDGVVSFELGALARFEVFHQGLLAIGFPTGVGPTVPSIQFAGRDMGTGTFYVRGGADLMLSGDVLEGWALRFVVDYTYVAYTLAFPDN